MDKVVIQFGRFAVRASALTPIKSIRCDYVTVDDGTWLSGSLPLQGSEAKMMAIIINRLKTATAPRIERQTDPDTFIGALQHVLTVADWESIVCVTCREVAPLDRRAEQIFFAFGPNVKEGQNRMGSVPTVLEAKAAFADITFAMTGGNAENVYTPTSFLEEFGAVPPQSSGKRVARSARRK